MAAAPTSPCCECSNRTDLVLSFEDRPSGATIDLVKEWIEALKKGNALRLVDAVEPRLSRPYSPVRAVFGTKADGAWVLVEALNGVVACNAELGEWRGLASGRSTGACFADDHVIIAWKNGGLVAVDLDGKTIWSEETPPEPLGNVEPYERAILHHCVNADGEVVVAYQLGCIRWLDPATGRERRRLALDNRSGTLRSRNEETGESDGPEYEAVFHEQIVGFDPTGRHAVGWVPWVYNGPHHPGDLRLWDFTSGTCETVQERTARPLHAAIAPGARWALMWGGWAAVELWDLVNKSSSYRPVKESAASTHWGPQAAISPNGRHWVSAVEREICLWETSAESPIDRIEMPTYPSPDGPIAFSPDGRSFYLDFEGHIVRVAVDPDAAR